MKSLTKLTDYMATDIEVSIGKILFLTSLDKMPQIILWQQNNSLPVMVNI